MKIKITCFLCLFLLLNYNSVFAQVSFKKHMISSRFVSEGVATADVNHDEKKDILAGNYWFEAPNWQPHLLHADTLILFPNTAQLF